jgi:exodeoxyribonuclease VII small subunit
MPAAKKTFEKAMKQLERIVQDLEAGELPLEKAIEKFEEGIELSKFCTEKLDETEKKISILVGTKEGKTVEEPFAPQEEPDDI